MTEVWTAPLWDTTPDNPPNVRDLAVGPATVADVRDFASRYHYARNAHTDGWRYGLWHGVTLYGVIVYNLPTRSVCECVFGPNHANHVLHMPRLVLSPDAKPNSESHLIGRSLRLLHVDLPDVWAVVTYADTTVGHIGYVYQATNALYTGTVAPRPYYLDAEGRRRAVYRDGKTLTPSAAAELGYTRHLSKVKHRYLYILGGRTQRRQRRGLLRLPVLPYPKAVAP